MNNIFLFVISAILIFVLNGCATYYISRDSFKQQFARFDSTNFKNVELNGGGVLMIDGQKYLANPVDYIECTDKKGNPVKLKNSPSMEIRLTHGEKRKKTIFYLDRVYVNDSFVTGVQSRFVSSLTKTIPLDSITKIEIQDGKKNYHYSDK